MSSRVLKSIQKLYPGYIEEKGNAPKTARMKEETKLKPKKKKTYVKPSSELEKMVDLLTTEPNEARHHSTKQVDGWRENALDSSRLQQLPSPPAIDNGQKYETYLVKSPGSRTEGQWFMSKRRHFSSKAIL